MGNIWGRVLSDTTTNIGAALATAGVGFVRNTMIGRSGDSDGLVYRTAKSYSSIIVNEAKQALTNAAKSAANDELQKIKSKWLKKSQTSDDTEDGGGLIENGNSTPPTHGKVAAEGGSIVALDIYGRAVDDALMIYFEGDVPVSYSTVKYKSTGKSVSGGGSSFTSKTVCHTDLVPQISVSTSKNVILTKVTGRDASRKELVSGGDLVFKVSGKIVGDKHDAFPVNEVRRFTEVMQYNGILNVDCFYFNDYFNVNRVVITDFDLSSPSAVNEQPYTFSCVAIEPNDAVKITSDTISIINQAILDADNDSWLTNVLSQKADELSNTAINLGLDAITSVI